MEAVTNKCEQCSPGWTCPSCLRAKFKVVSHPIQFKPIDVVGSYQLEIEGLKADVMRLENLLRDSVDVRREALRWAFRQFMELNYPDREAAFIKRGLKELE